MSVSDDDGAGCIQDEIHPRPRRDAVNRVLPFLVLTPLIMPSPAPGGETPEAEARRIVDKALRALGGKEKLAATKAATFNARGKFYWFGAATDFTGEFAVEGTTKGRSVFHFEFMGKKQTIIAVINGKEGWVKSNNMVVDVDSKTLATQMGDHGYVTEMAMLLPLARGDKGIMLLPLGESKEGDRPVTGVEVSRKDYTTVRLYFDKETALPLKLELKAFVEGKNETHDILFDDYKEVGGLKVAMKLTARRNGKVYYEYEMSDVKLLDRLDEKLLEKPR
jgi:hypothetical protein